MYIFERLINWLDAHSCVNIGRKIKVIIWGKFRQNEDEFYAEKTKYQAETETLKKQAQETQQKMQEMLLDNALKDAFTESGGRWDAASGGQQTPFEIIQAYLKDGRCELKDKQLVFKNRYGNIEYGADGNPKSIYQKMNELKQSATFKPFFIGGDSSGNNNSNGGRAVNDSLQKFEDGGNPQQQQTQTGRKSYTRDQARKGKASINDIASGKADIR